VTQQMDMVGRYKQLRQIGLSLNMQLTKILSKSEIHEGGRKLGILKNETLVLENEDEIAILMDFCLHDVRRYGINAIDRFLAQSPPPLDSDTMLILQGKREARYSLFMVEATEPGIGVRVRDLLYEEDVFITDVGFSTSAEIGLVMAFRLMTVDGINMTTGAALPLGVVPTSGRAEFFCDVVTRFKKMVSPGSSPEERSELVASMIRACLQKGAASRIRYNDPEPRPRSSQPATRVISAQKTRVGRNDPCPCGSGKKFKHCCGGRS
jgi:hypothetical protein